MERPLCQCDGCLHAGRAAADDHHITACSTADQILVVIHCSTAGNRIRRAGEIAVLHHGLVALHTAHALSDQILSAGPGLVDPFRVCHLPSGDTNEVADALLQQLFCRGGKFDSVDRNNRDLHMGFYSFRQLLPPPFFIVVGFDHVGHCLIDSTADVECIRTGSLQRFRHFYGIGQGNAALHKVAAVDPHTDGISAAGSSNTVDDLCHDAAAILDAAAIFVRSLVGIGADKGAQQISMGGVEFDTVDPGLLAVDCRCHKFFDDVADLLFGHLCRDQSVYLVEDGAGTHRLLPVIQCGRGLPAAVVELNKDSGAVTVDPLRHALYTAYMLAGGDAELIGITGAAGFIHPGKLRENQAAAASGTILIESDQFRRCLSVPGSQSVSHGCHCDTVADLYSADIPLFKQFLIVHFHGSLLIKFSQEPVSRGGMVLAPSALLRVRFPWFFF